MRPCLAALIGLFLIGWTTGSAQAQSAPCDLRAKVLSTLEGKYAETPASLGLASNGAMIELLTSDAGTWTILTTLPNGLSCLVAAGRYWENLPKKVSGVEM